MDKALDLGIDGWKLDGSVRLAPLCPLPLPASAYTAQWSVVFQDPFIWLLLERAYGYAGRVRKADYSDQFYRTFMDHRSVPVCEHRSAPHTARTHPTTC